MEPVLNYIHLSHRKVYLLPNFDVNFSKNEVRAPCPRVPVPGPFIVEPGPVRWSLTGPPHTVLLAPVLRGNLAVDTGDTGGTATTGDVPGLY